MVVGYSHTSGLTVKTTVILCGYLVLTVHTCGQTVNTTVIFVWILGTYTLVDRGSADSLDSGKSQCLKLDTPVHRHNCNKDKSCQ